MKLCLRTYGWTVYSINRRERPPRGTLAHYIGTLSGLFIYRDVRNNMQVSNESLHMLFLCRRNGYRGTVLGNSGASTLVPRKHAELFPAVTLTTNWTFWHRSQYSETQRAGRFRVRTPVGSEIFTIRPNWPQGSPSPLYNR